MSAPNRVAALLRGGAGNQLFQLAAALSVVEYHDLSRVNLLSYGNEWGPDNVTLTDLTGVTVTYPDRLARSTLPGIAVKETWRDSVSEVLARIWGSLAGTHVFRQSDPYGPRPAEPTWGRTSVLEGFFQNREWWWPTWKLVAHLINDQRPARVDDLRGRSNTVVKLRRSDYVGRGIVLSDDYYRSALDVLGVFDCPVVVICEDPEATIQFEGLLRERGCSREPAEQITGNSSIDDFWNLAAGSRHVLANSSFSWWAAAVAEVAGANGNSGLEIGTQTHVVYPRPWLPNAWSHGPIPDMGLPAWCALEVKFE